MIAAAIQAKREAAAAAQAKREAEEAARREAAERERLERERRLREGHAGRRLPLRRPGQGPGLRPAPPLRGGARADRAPRGRRAEPLRARDGAHRPGLPRVPERRRRRPLLEAAHRRRQLRHGRRLREHQRRRHHSRLGAAVTEYSVQCGSSAKVLHSLESWKYGSVIQRRELNLGAALAILH